METKKTPKFVIARNLINRTRIDVLIDESISLNRVRRFKKRLPYSREYGTMTGDNTILESLAY